MGRRILTIFLACLCLISGFLTTYRVMLRFRQNIISQHEEKLSDVANSVDRSLQGYLRICSDSLEYVTGRQGFLEAQSIWEETGKTEELLLCLEEMLLHQDMRIKTLLAIEEGSVLLSTDGNIRYLLPDTLTDSFLCQDETGRFYFAVLHRGQELSYAALIELDVLCSYLVESSAVNDTDRMLLIDPGAKLAVQYLAGETKSGPLTEELLAHSPSLTIACQAVNTDTRKVSLYEAEEGGSTSTVGYVLIGDKASANGFFTVCILDAYDTYLDALRWDSLLLIAGCSAILLGIVLLLSYAGSISQENRKAAKKLERLKERQKTLEQINRQTQQLAHHQRLETIGTLTSSISHEFNNLLTPIMSYSLLTLEKLPPEEEELSDNLIEIYNASQKAKEIISRLSDLSRKNSPKTFRQVSVDGLVQKALDIAMPAKPEQVEVKLNLNCWDQRVRANEIQICQMLLNLILNAFHAMEQGGILKIATTFDDHFVNLRLTDTGCGIPKDIQGKIFDPFFTTKESGKGTGLGLAIVAQVVEDHMGTIRVDSTPGHGTRFEVRLPRLGEADQANGTCTLLTAAMGIPRGRCRHCGGQRKKPDAAPTGIRMTGRRKTKSGKDGLKSELRCKAQSITDKPEADPAAIG